LKLRVLTGLVIVAVALVVVLVLPVEIASLIFALVTFGALAEFITIVRRVLPTAPLRWLYFWVPGLVLLGVLSFHQPDAELSAMGLFGLLTGLLLAVVVTTLFSATEMKDAVGALGVLAFAIPYFALPQIAFYWLVTSDRWLVILLIALVGMGDTLAYFVGRAWGKHRFAPVVSPKKSWEGAVGGLLGSVLTAAVWCYCRSGEIDPRYLILAVGTAVVGQLGDLVESLVKRSAGVKDSSGLLPGHGGLYDRLDALLLAAPAFALFLWLLGLLPGKS